ncbi:hypothetical protein FJR45_07595 [Sulfurimonas sediminis]|uniref:Uncharacterized protein n=1 Tax=Sulfurimonas sediminis TaxID=2590020 RepID=A0A7M1B547_9BACT|nr:hypothetical protein [Sulfurimonas sediminis]QOP43822.1 hypothetical protein FJR45_07595 [Sulfurimonas sediminis]
MNKKSRFCLFTCSVLIVVAIGEILYLQKNNTLTRKELETKRAFVKTTTVSNFVLALKNNSIKTMP